MSLAGDYQDLKTTFFRNERLKHAAGVERRPLHEIRRTLAFLEIRSLVGLGHSVQQELVQCVTAEALLMPQICTSLLLDADILYLWQ